MKPVRTKKSRVATKKPFAALSMRQQKAFLKRSAAQFAKDFGPTIKALARE